MTNEEVKEVYARAEMEYDMLKDRVHDLYDKNVKLQKQLDFMIERNDEKQQKIDKAIDYTKRFINGKTSSIDEWKNVELVLETIVEILGDKEND